MIRIGIEVSRRNLHYDILEHPERYFFILLADGRASLCIRTCDALGENIKVHIIDGFSLNEDGCLYSVFESGINDAIFGPDYQEGDLYEKDEYPLTSYLMQMISGMPELVDWIISSILSADNNLVIYSMDI